MVSVPVWLRVPAVPSSSAVGPRVASASALKPLLSGPGISTFSTRDRLRTKADFASLRGGIRLVCGGVRLIYVANGLQHARIGLAVSRKYGNAVQRNKLKRQWRESFRGSDVRLIGVDILAIPVCPYCEMVKPVEDMQRALERLDERLRQKNR